MCRLENLPGPTALKRMMDAMLELFCDSFTEVPRRILLDIDDILDRGHGGQQLALFHAQHLKATLEAHANGHPQSRIDDLMPWAFKQPSS